MGSDLDLLCFSVSVLGVYNYTTADFVRGDVYNAIRTYLYVGSSKSFKHANACKCRSNGMLIPGKKRH